MSRDCCLPLSAACKAKLGLPRFAFLPDSCGLVCGAPGGGRRGLAPGPGALRCSRQWPGGQWGSLPQAGIPPQPERVQTGLLKWIQPGLICLVENCKKQTKPHTQARGFTSPKNQALSL